MNEIRVSGMTPDDLRVFILDAVTTAVGPLKTEIHDLKEQLNHVEEGDFTRAGAAMFLQKNIRTIDKYKRNGVLKVSHMVGNSPRFRRADVIALKTPV